MSEEVAKRIVPSVQQGLQRHHDYYVTLERQEKLFTDEDREQYELAIRREKNGEVKPIPEEDQDKGETRPIERPNFSSQK